LARLRWPDDRGPLKHRPSAGDAFPDASTGGHIKEGKAMKFRLYKLAFALASLAAIAEILGAGRRF
jgi:hypothetical protein